MLVPSSSNASMSVIRFTIQWVKKVRTQLLHSYVVPYFSTPTKVTNTAISALIPFLVNPQDSEVFKMVCIAIVARLDPTH